MPTYLSPGVYVEEIPSATKPIEGVGTSIAAFVGLAPGGPINTPMRISNWSQFVRIYGDTIETDNGPFMEGAYLAHSVYGFFQNGGQLCWIVRVGKEGAGARPQAALPAATDSSIEAFKAVALPEVTDQVKVVVSEEPTGPDKETTYKIVIDAGIAHEEFEGLSVKKGKNNLATKVNAKSKLISITDASAALPTDDPKIATGSYALAAPAHKPESLSSGDFEGDVSKRQGMGGLEAVDEVTMICMPDLMTLPTDGADGDVSLRDLQGKMIAHCENAGDRMAILDAPGNMLPQDILEWRMNAAGYDSKFATLYYPWIEVMDPISKKPIMVPPSGHVAGVWCRSDATRGVHKAPANEVVSGINGIQMQITQAEQGALNQNGINCIRAFPGRGIRIWGARTLSSDPEWRYINVRRLFNFVSESLMDGTQWSVFEPNDQRLWAQIEIAVTGFLTSVWRDGALFGNSPAEAFYVKCDSETNPPDAIDAGRVTCEIGIAPVKPAEFVVFKLSQFSAGSEAG